MGIRTWLGKMRGRLRGRGAAAAEAPSKEATSSTVMARTIESGAVELPQAARIYAVAENIAATGNSSLAKGSDLSPDGQQIALQIAPILAREKALPRTNMRARALVDFSLREAIGSGAIVETEKDLIMLAARMYRATGNERILNGLETDAKRELARKIVGIMDGRITKLPGAERLLASTLKSRDPLTQYLLELKIPDSEKSGLLRTARQLINNEISRGLKPENLDADAIMRSFSMPMAAAQRDAVDRLVRLLVEQRKAGARKHGQ